MAYCVLADVKAKCQMLPMNPAATPPVTKPTKEQVEQFIDDCSEEIDGIIATLGYVTPATGTKTLKLLRKICSDGAAFYAMNAAFSGGIPNRSEQGNEYGIAYRNALGALRKGEMILPDAPTGTHYQVEPRETAFTYSFEADEDDDLNITEIDKEY